MAHSKRNKTRPTVTILLTALYEGWTGAPYSKGRTDGFFKVPYSDHSSFAELQEMVGRLRPRRLLPIVLRFSETRLMGGVPDQRVKADMTQFQRLLSPLPAEPFDVPPAVQRVMADGGPMLTKPPKKTSRGRRVVPRAQRPMGGPRGVVFRDMDEDTAKESSDIDLATLSQVVASSPRHVADGNAKFASPPMPRRDSIGPITSTQVLGASQPFTQVPGASQPFTQVPGASQPFTQDQGTCASSATMGSTLDNLTDLTEEELMPAPPVDFQPTNPRSNQDPPVAPQASVISSSPPLLPISLPPGRASHCNAARLASSVPPQTLPELIRVTRASAASKQTQLPLASDGRARLALARELRGQVAELAAALGLGGN